MKAVFAVVGVVAIFGGGLVAGRALASPSGDPLGSPELREEELLRRVSAAGWLTVRPEGVRDLTGALMDARGRGDSLTAENGRLTEANARLAEDVRLLGGEVAAVTELLAEVETSLRVQAEHGPPESDEIASGTFDDGVFSGSILYRDPPGVFELDSLRARFLASLVTTELETGAVLVSARTSDPRARLSIESARIEPAAPITRCTFGTKMKVGGAGAAFGAVIGILFGG